MTTKNIILWDWDNTLVDTFRLVCLAQNEMRSFYHLPLLSDEEVKLSMNKSGYQLMLDLFGKEKAQEALQKFIDCYAQHSHDLKLKKNAKEILSWAKDHHFYNVLASNKNHQLLLKEVAFVGLSELFDNITGAGKAKEDKPSKLFTDEAIKGFSFQKLISIGDGVADVKMGHNYPKGQSVLVFTNPNNLEFKDNKPDFWAKDLTACQKILEKLI